MPLEIDPSLAKNLPTVLSATKYPLALARRLWHLNQSLPERTPTFRLVSVLSVITGKEKAITWYGFRSGSNARLQQFYVCAFPNGTPMPSVDLYDIGAVGNTFDTDLLLTDTNANLLTTGFYEALRPSYNENPVTLNPGGFYEARHARWDSSARPKRAENEMLLKCSSPCLLWVISYRHSKYGSRKYDPFPIPVGDIAILQDDDGSPGDGEPGGEGGP